MKQFFKIMLATMCGLIVFSIIGTCVLSGVVGAMASLSNETETKLKAHSVYQLKLKGQLVEQSDDDEYQAALSEALGRPTSTQIGLNDILDNIKKAKEDPNIDGIYLYGGSLGAGFASMHAIREALKDFRESGKFVVAYADDYGQLNYYLASVADKVCLNAHGSVNWSGLATNITFFTRLLEKIGIEMQVVKVGQFKSAVEPYMLTEMSESNRKQMNILLTDIWDEVLKDVSVSRNISIEQLNRYADMNLGFRDENLLPTYGMVDTLVYVQDMKAILTELTGTKDYKLVSHSDMKYVPSTNKYQKDRIAVLYAEGDIVDNGTDGIVGRKMVSQIDKLREKDNIKAVVLRVNSPGGSAYASEQIWNALSRLKKEKPLIVSMGDYAASGGYYISCVADTIIAENNTLTGSIGIFGMIPNFSKLRDKIGLDSDGLGTNRLSLMASNISTKGMNAEERAIIQGHINRGYELFVKRCADGRNMTTAQIKEIAEGRVWSGKRALEIGLVDKIGDLQDAIDIAAQMANLDKYKVVTFPEKEDKITKLINKLSGSDTEEMILYKQIKAMVEKPAVMARLPYMIEIK